MKYLHEESEPGLGPESSRRSLLAAGMGLAGAGLLGGGWLDPAGTASAQSPPTYQPPPSTADLSPEDALALLYQGNARFVAGKPAAPHRDLERIKEVAPQQKPFAAFLGCADSRVPIEIVFDQGFGDLFVTRIAGNVTTPECLGSLEFGALVLGARVLYVLGHTNCGAVTAAAKRRPVPGQISTLFQHLRPAVKSHPTDIDAAIRENVRTQAEIISEASPVIAQLIAEGKLKVAGGVYDIATGRVEPVEL